MIYEYILPQAGPNWIQISDSLGPLWLRWIFWAVYIFGAACLFYFVNKGKSSKVLSLAAVILPLFALAAIYHAVLNIPDEAFVNLTHSFNLFHHGRFSFSQHAMLDGTVEYIYYILLAPFSWSQSSLICAAGLLGFLVALGHIETLNQFFKPSEDPLLKFFVLSGFALYLPFQAEIANGFGNGLVSMMYLAGLLLQWKGMESQVSWITFTLPLLRPDGILYSGALILGALLRKESRNYIWRHGAAALLGASFYFGITKLIYGHWLPTPMLFKAFSAHQVLNWKSLVRDLSDALINYQRFLLFITLLFAAAFVKEKKTRLLLTQFLIMVVIRFYYTYSLDETHYGSKGRYYLPFEILLFLVPVQAVYHEIWRRGSFLSKIPQKAWRGLFLILVIFVFGNVRFFNNTRGRTQYLATSGQIFAKYFPKDWSVANTELNTFGFFADHDVVDLWGYTDREIALSSSRSVSGVKSKPDIIYFKKPDVIHCWWLYSFIKWSPQFTVPLLDPLKSKDYEYILTTVNGGHLYDQIAPKDWISDYDVYILFADQPYASLFLIRKEHHAEIQERLKNEGLILNYQRPLNKEKLEMFYGPLSAK